MNTIVKSLGFDKINAGDVEAFETMLGWKLPQDYKEFLIENNGGHPQNKDCPAHNFAIRLFYGINKSEDHYYDLRHQMQYEPFDQKDQLAIAEDGFGNKILLYRYDLPCVYFWDHDTGVAAKIYKSFSELWNALAAIQYDDSMDKLVSLFRNKQTEEICNLLEKGLSPNAKNSYGYSLAQSAAAYDNVIVLETLHAYGADFHNAAHSAAKNANLKIILKLIELGVPIDEKDEKELTPLSYAVQVNAVEVVEALLAAGANPCASPQIKDEIEFHINKTGRNKIRKMINNTIAHSNDINFGPERTDAGS